MLERPTKLKSYQFDQLADQINDRVIPAEAGVERYVGLEHLDSDSLRIRRWGDPSEVESTKLRFQSGDIIFGKRRVYQRKVAVADTEGICSAHAMVLRAKPEVVLPEFLPFFMQSDLFMARALSISVGSLSPTINWKALAKEEFQLPPIRDQARFVEAFGSISGLCERFLDLLAAVENLLYSSLNETFRPNVDTKPLAEWCRNLITYGIVQAGRDTPGGVPYVRVSDMTDTDELTPEGMLRTTGEIAHKYRRSMVETGDIVIALRGPVGLARFVPESLNGANLTQGTARVSVSQENSSGYVFWALQSPLVKHVYASHAKGSTFSEISLEALRKLPIPVLAHGEQERLANKFKAISDKRSEVRARLDAAQLLRHQFFENSLSL